MERAILFWILLLVVAIGTFCLRYSFIALLEKIDEPPWFRRALKYIPVAVMSALVASSIFVVDGSVSIDWTNKRLVAAVFAGVIGYLTRSLLWTILSGLLILYALNHWLA